MKVLNDFWRLLKLSVAWGNFGIWINLDNAELAEKRGRKECLNFETRSKSDPIEPASS